MALSGTASKPHRSNTVGQNVSDAAIELPERDYNAALDSTVAQAVMAAWAEHKGFRSTAPKDPQESLEKIRAIIATIYTAEMKHRQESRLIVQADVVGHSVCGRPADQVVLARAKNTLLYLSQGKALAGLGDTALSFINDVEVEETDEMRDDLEEDNDSDSDSGYPTADVL